MAGSVPAALSQGRGLEIPPWVWDAMRCHVAREAPLEACGLLAGHENRVESCFSIRNALQSEVRFRMDAQEQLDAFEQAELAGQDILAIYHSHPKGPPMPSATDLAEAAYDVVYIIWWHDGADWHARGFWLEEKSATQVFLQGNE